MDIVLYSKRNCTFCVQAENLLSIRGFNYKKLMLDEDFAREYLLEQYPNARTFPVVTIGGMFIGGYEELYTYLESVKSDGRKFLAEVA